jgi:integrase/recombinase XerD
VVKPSRQEKIMNAGESARRLVTGPLEPFEMPFRAELARQGYTSRSTCDLVGSMASLSWWLQNRALSPSGLTPHVVAEVRIAQLGTVLRFLREIGAVPAAHSAVGTTPVEALLAEFRAWLAGKRGLSAATVLL